MDSGDDRYERRLVEETSKLRVEAAGMEVRLIDRIGQAENALRQQMGGLREDMGARIGGLRHEMGGLEVRLVDRISQAESGLRKDMSGLEVRLLKWSFAFWIGQVAAIGAIMTALLR